jgi:Domain of unknown function (DUF4276)
MKIIGLIGEDPNDCHAIKQLLLQKYNKQFKFVSLLKNIKGSCLDNKRTANSLAVEFKTTKTNCILFIRDTDGIFTEIDKTKKVENWFKKLNEIVNKQGILLCNTYELEALILADINTFNTIYKSTIKFSGDVSYKKDPKGFLKEKTKKLQRQYRESDSEELFAKLRFDEVKKNCKYFKEFISIFEKKNEL